MQVSIITINYNSSLFTIKLVNSILENVSNLHDYEIIITDNSSDSNDYENLVNKLPRNDKIRLYRNKVNNGFSGGNMDGYEKSNGKYLLFINNDCQCINDVVHPLVEFIENNSNVGLLTGKVRGNDGKYTGTHKLFPSLSKNLFGTRFARLLLKDKFISPKKAITKPTKVQVVTGAFMFFSREVFENINGFDRKFFLDCEEEDISKRVWDIGKEVYMLPEPEIIHEHGGSKKDNKNDLRNEYYISYKKLLFKHYSKPYAIVMLLLTYFKLFKLSITGNTNLSLLKIALMGFSERYSLRYKQKEKN
ncbi:MAG: glycosyltransferase family 2 protein [Gammaproteobacteria bacterium]|jgi:GT2 family glycosyltransferase